MLLHHVDIQPHARHVPATMLLHHERRALCGSLLTAVALAAAPAAAKVDSVNPANNYYFPMARYRYAPRILRAWIAVDELATPVLAAGRWDDMEIVWSRMDDAVTAMPLFTNAVEGSRSTKRKTKTDTQKMMAADTKAYGEACKQCGRCPNYYATQAIGWWCLTMQARGVDVGKWREAATYGRLPVAVAQFLLDWLPVHEVKHACPGGAPRHNGRPAWRWCAPRTPRAR